MIRLKSRHELKLIIILIIILLLELVPLSRDMIKQTLSFNIIHNEDWGLGYGSNGEQPIGNKDKNFLEKYDSYYVGNNKEKVIYLTFDAGYENGYTSKLLDILQKHNVPAAFFLVGDYIKKNEDLVIRMTEEGHLVCNHTMHHPNMSAIEDINKFKEELEGIEQLYKNITGKDLPKYYRPPEGKFSETNLNNAMKLGYSTIFWSLAYVDWKNDQQPSKDYALSKLITRIHPGAIVLLHSNSKTNSEILDLLIETWKKDGYEFKSLDDLTKGK